MRRAVQVLVWLFVGYALILVGAYLLQRWLIYPAPRAGEPPRAAGARLLEIPGPSGRTVYALFRPGNAGARVVVHFHGNGELLSDQRPLVEALGARGLGVLAVEYPGYGLASTSGPSEARVYEDAEVALRHLTSEIGVEPKRVVLSGQSLGSGVATEMASRGYGSRLVLLSPFTSLMDMARRSLPIVPASLILRDRYDNLGKAPRLELPTLVIHGERDQIVPFEMGQRLGTAFPRARLLRVRDAGHNDLFASREIDVLTQITEFARAH